MLYEVITGAALAVSGAILQGMIRNPLASPDIIGISGGATLGAVLYFYYFAGTVSIHFLPIGSIIGAFVATFVRITSYNVCYTKLLRIFNTFIPTDLSLSSGAVNFS